MNRVVSLLRPSVRVTQSALAPARAVRVFSSKPPTDGKPPKEDALEKELEKLTQQLKTEFEQSDKNVDKNFMNFRAQNEAETYKRSMIFNWRTALVTLAIGGSCLAALFYVRKVRLDEREKQRKLTAGKARIGGEWQLVNAVTEKKEGSQELRGNWLLLYFGFTHCPDICPDEIEKMMHVIEILKRDAARSPNEPDIPIKPIFISVDPARDTIARVKEYCAEFSTKEHQLQGYTGDKEQVNAVAKTFRVYHSQGPKTADDDYIVDHTVIMYLIDPEGNFHDYYGQNRKAEEIANVIKMKVLKHQLANKKGFFNL